MKPAMNNNPPNDIIGGWSAEFNGRENWRDLGGTFDHWWEAAMALIEDDSYEKYPDLEVVDNDREIDVGIFRDPAPPETLVDATWAFDALYYLSHDDYHEGSGNDLWLVEVSNAKREELEAAIRATVGAWLDKHGLRPTWKVVDRKWTVTAGQARAAAAAAANAKGEAHA